MLFEMANLNKTEKLIALAAKRLEPIGTRTIDQMMDYYDKVKFETKVDHPFIINYLYFQNHKGRTFENIAKEVLHISLSTLEEYRIKYQNMFLYILEKVKNENLPAA